MVNQLKKLKDIYRDQLQQQNELALENDGQVIDDDLKKLERLGKLIEINKSQQRGPIRNMWLVVSLLVTGLVIMIVLIFYRVPRMNVELNMKISGFSFQLSEQVLAEDMSCQELGISEIRTVTFPRAAAQEADRLELSVLPLNLEAGKILLNDLYLPHSTHLKLAIPDKNQPLILDLTCPVDSSEHESNRRNQNILVSISGRIVTNMLGKQDTLSTKVPKAIGFQPTEKGPDFDLTFVHPGTPIFPVPLKADSLVFFQTSQYIIDNKTYFRTKSTILEGSVFMEALNGQEIAIRENEELHFDSIKGHFQTLKIVEGHLEISFYGEVRGMTRGPSKRSMMPSYLDLILAHQGLIGLLWGSLIYFFTLMLGIFNWWSKYYQND